jgi:hypothetical protein
MIQENPQFRRKRFAGTGLTSGGESVIPGYNSSSAAGSTAAAISANNAGMMGRGSLTSGASGTSIPPTPGMGQSSSLTGGRMSYGAVPNNYQFGAHDLSWYNNFCDVYWHNYFYIDNNNVPFFLAGLKERILQTGKYIAVLSDSSRLASTKNTSYYTGHRRLVDSRILSLGNDNNCSGVGSSSLCGAGGVGFGPDGGADSGFGRDLSVSGGNGGGNAGDANSGNWQLGRNNSRNNQNPNYVNNDQDSDDDENMNVNGNSGQGGSSDESILTNFTNKNAPKHLHYTENEAVYIPRIDAAYHYSSNKLLDFFVKKMDLKRRLMTFRSLFFLEKSDW